MAGAVWVVATTSHDEHDQEMLSACRVAVQATLVVGFVLLYTWIPAFSIGSVGYEQWLAGFGAPALVQKVSQIAVLASLGLTALVVGAMLLLTRGRPACGRRQLLMIPFTAVAITAIREFRNPQSLAAFVAAGLVAEGLACQRVPSRRRTLLLGALVPTDNLQVSGLLGSPGRLGDTPELTVCSHNCSHRMSPAVRAVVAIALAQQHGLIYGNPAAVSGWVGHAQRMLDDCHECVAHGLLELFLGCIAPSPVDRERRARAAVEMR